MEKMEVDDELELLEKVFLRFGSADTDEQLETVLAKFLVPVLYKLSGNITRKKVMELLVHVNKRVKSRPKVLLPVVDLLKQYSDSDTPPFVANFTILYIKMGYPRLALQDQLKLVPSILGSLDKRPPQHQESLLQLIIPVLGSVVLPSSLNEQKEQYGLSENPVTQELFLEFCLNFLLLPYALLLPPPKNAPPPTEEGEPPPTAPPCLNFATYRRIISDALPTPEQVEDNKVGIVRFLASPGLFHEHKIAIHFIIAHADSRHRVASAADKEIKRIFRSVDLDESKFVDKLYSLYQGSPVTKNPKSVEDVRTPANTRIRLKLFPYFLRSKEATNHFPGCVQVIFDTLYGQNTNHKLKTMTVQFVHHVCQYCSDEKFLPISKVLLSAMTKFLGETLTDLKLRGLIYLAIGKIARRTPSIIAADMALISNLFEALSHEETETRLAVQETLSMLSGVVRDHLSESNLTLLEALIMQNIEKEDVQSRQIAMHFAMSVFPADHVPSRYALLLAAGDSKDDIRAQAVKALTYIPKSEKQLLEVRMDQDSQERQMPMFADMIRYINNKSTERMKKNNKFVLGNHAVAFNPATFTQLLTYLRQCLAYNAGVDLDTETQTHGPVLGKYVRDLAKTDGSSVHSYVELLIQHLSIFGGDMVMYYLLEIVAVARDLLSLLFVERLDWIRNLMFSTQERTRERAAELYAIVLVSACSSETRLLKLDYLAKTLDNKVEEMVSGSTLGIANTVGRLYLYKLTQDDSSRIRCLDIAKQSVMVIDKHVSSHSQTLSLSSLTSLGELGRCTRIPIENTSENENDVTKQSVVKKLIGIVQRTKEASKVRERAATSLGLLCVGEPEFPFKHEMLDGMIEAAGPHQLELHFTIGEALVNAVLANAAPIARDAWTVDAATHQDSLSEKDKKLELKYLLTKLLEKANKEENPHKKQAICIWLLSIVKHCGTYQDVQDNLKQIQVAFMHLLIENNEVTQDIASKGLGTVYEVCGDSIKDELVQLLVRTLTTGQTENQNLATYKELCAIASDLNQPDLVYKFMHLANHQGVWRTNKGAQLGFSSIAQQAAAQLSPELHKIVPKLYRYQYDPNSKIQNAMASIWSAVVPDTKATVDKYLEDIINDLLKNLTSGNWRVRESCCSAVADLLRGRTLEEVLDKLPELWKTCFKVRDDMKESVRNAAETALRSLSRLTVNLCDVNHGKLGESAIRLVFPTLLENGLLNPCKEVQTVALAAILKISKNAGSLLKPHIPLLVSALLESLSGLEPPVNDYISLHVGNDENVREKLDMARIAASRGSPMMETINHCTQYVDEEVLTQLVPRLIDLIRSGIGVGTKAGVAGYVISLIQHSNTMLAPYSGKLMSALLNGLGDISMAVKKSYASALGHLVKISRVTSTEKLFAKLKTWYFEKEDVQLQTACGVTIYEICKSSPDVLERHGDVALPLAFLAMHVESKDSVWTDVWNDVTTGMESGVKQYLPQILGVIQTALTSQSWAMKATSARAIKTLVDNSKTGLEQPHAGELVQLLIQGLSGRIWQGKETLLQAFTSVCISCKSTIMNDEEMCSKALGSIYKECKKERLDYKLEALKCYSSVTEEFAMDKFEEVYELVQPIIDKREKVEEDQDEEEEKMEVEEDSQTILKFEEGCLQILGQIFPKTWAGQKKYVLELSGLLSASLRKGTWKLQIQAMRTMKVFWERLDVGQCERCDVLEAVRVVMGPLCKCLVDLKYAAVRTAALDVCSTMLQRLNEQGLQHDLSECQVTELYDHLDSMITENQPVLVERVAKMRKTLRVLLDEIESRKVTEMEVPCDSENS